MNGLRRSIPIIFWVLFCLLPFEQGQAGIFISPSEDREINHLYYGTYDTVVLNDGQWWPAVRFVSSPEEEQRVVMRYDLSPHGGGFFSRATLKFYVKEAWNFNAIALDTWFYESGSTIGPDDFALGIELVGTYQWSAPVPGVEINTIGHWVSLDVTDAVNNRAGDLIFFNIRLAGSYPGFDGNTFASTGAHHNVILGAVENGAFAPSLELTPECIADADEDRDLDGTDLLLLTAEWQAACSPASPCTCDFNGDNTVDAKDLADLAADFGRTNCPDEIVYAIRGRVFGTNTSQPGPLSGVTVSVGDRETTTDANGRFELVNLPNADFTLQVDGWHYAHGPYGQVHFDLVIPPGDIAIENFTVRLPYIGPAGKVVIEEGLAEISALPNGSKTALMKGDLTIAVESDGRPVSLRIKEDTLLTFPPGVETALAVTHLGPDGMPVSLPTEPGSGQPLYTLNTFTIQPEGVTFSEPPELIFGDHDGLPTGTSYLIYHYGSWEDQTPPAPPTKLADGTVTVSTGMTESGTFAVPPNPLEFAPSSWKLTTLTGRVVVWSEDGGSFDPVAGAEVSGGINGGVTDADGRFSFQVLSQLPTTGTDTLAVSAHAFKALADGLLYSGMKSQEYSNPNGVTDLGDVELNRLMRLTETRPMPYDANVDPLELVSADPSGGIKLRFDRPLEEEAPTSFNIVRLPMLHPLYPQKKIAIPEAWGEFDPDLYDCARQNMTVTFSCEPPGCNEPIVDSDCLSACNEDCDNERATCLSCISECRDDCESDRASCLDDCPADCVAACEGDPDPDCYTECMSCVPNCNAEYEDCAVCDYCGDCDAEHGTCYLNCSACGSGCVECPENQVNTAIFNLSGCGYSAEDLYNQWWWFVFPEMEAGLRGLNGEVLLDPDLTGNTLAMIYGETVAALLGYVGMVPELMLWFATMEDPAAKPAPLLGLLIPDDEDPSGFVWHDYDTLTPATTLEVEPGTTLRIQAEDQTFMKRITVRLGDDTFVKTTSDPNEKDYLMHLEVPFPENAGPEPILLTVTAEGKAHEFLKTVNHLEGHKTGFEVYLSPLSNGPVIELVSPSAGLFVGDTVIFQLTGSGFHDVQTATIIDPDDNPKTIGFTIDDDARITLAGYTFAMAGPHRIRLTSLEGQGEMSVVVETPGAQTRWTMKGQSNTNYDDLSLHLNNFNVTPEPYLGVDQVSVTSVIEGVSAAGLEAELPTEAGNTLRSSTVDILQIDDAAIQGRVLTTPGDLGGWNQLYYREVITTFGLELADGSTVTEGTVPCHLEISGTASRDDFGPHGWVFFIYKVAASVLEPGTPLSDDPVTFIGEAPTPIGAVEIQRVSLEDWPTGSTNFTVESESFNLPVCGQVAFFPQDYESALEWRITNMTGNQAAVSLNARLVCDDPGVKLIYRK